MKRFLSFFSKGRHFALPVECVKEILAIRAVSEIPSSNIALRGGITVRGGVLPLFDFRSLIGAPRLLEEREQLVEILNAREQEHVEWLDALTKSVVEGVEFRKATNPRACAFGKWYYSFKAPDTQIERLLGDFEEPHNEIHALASKVLELAKTDKDSALEIVKSAKRTTLLKLLTLFSDLKTTLISDIRELAIIYMSEAGETFAIAVDAVESIRDFERERFQSRLGLETSPLIAHIWSTEQQTVLEVNTKVLDRILAEGSDLRGGLNEPA